MNNDVKYDSNNPTPWIKHWLPLVESKIDERYVKIIKLKNGMMDGINHSFKSIGLLIESRSMNKFKTRKYITATRAAQLYILAMKKLKFYADEYEKG